MSAPPSNRIDRADLTLPIEGMTCASCVNRVERFLRSADGVVEANVNLATERATIKYDPLVVGRAELERAVEDAGYEVRAEARPTDGALAGSLGAEADAQIARQARGAATARHRGVRRGRGRPVDDGPRRCGRHRS